MKEQVSLIEALSNANGAPGFEDEVIEAVKNYQPKCFAFEKDSMKNMYMTAKDKKDAKGITVMLDAHSDEVAFMVQAVKSNGLIKVVPLGGWVANNVLAQKVRVLTCKGTYVKGIVSTKPTHFMTDEEMKINPTMDDIYIDVGALSAKEVKDVFEIEIGAPVVPDVTFEYFESNGLMMGKAFDNRLGCACVIETMKRIGDKPMNLNIIGAIASQEEVGTRGAKVTARKVKPDIAIVFEGTPADDNFRERDIAQSVLRQGPQIRLLDRCMISNTKLVTLAKKVAKEREIPFQLAVRTGGGTNGGAIHVSNSGVPTLVLGVPVRYVHTHNCIATIDDFNWCVELALGVIDELQKDGFEGVQ